MESSSFVRVVERGIDGSIVSSSFERVVARTEWRSGEEERD